jgi:hypothetical protein
MGLFDRPYVQRTISSITTNKMQQGVFDIALLGVVLLELCFGKPIEEHPIRQQNQTSDESIRPSLDFVAALNWLRDVDGEAGEDYFKAVKWCLHESNTLRSASG